jgi:quinol monooxygenase YgiN
MTAHAASRRAFLVQAATAAAAAALAGPRPAAAEAAPPAGWIAAVTRIHGISGREADLEQHLLSLSAPTRAEPGCVVYDLYRDPAHPHEFLRFEIWTSAAALEAHKQTPHLRASFEKRQREGWTTEITIWERVPG